MKVFTRFTEGNSRIIVKEVNGNYNIPNSIINILNENFVTEKRRERNYLVFHFSREDID